MKLTSRTTSTSSTEVMARIAELKADVDGLLKQLSDGEYLSVYTFANNWVHLTSLYEKVQEQMNDQSLMEQLVRFDLLLAADLLAVGRMITIMDNFLRCAITTR